MNLELLIENGNLVPAGEPLSEISPGTIRFAKDLAAMSDFRKDLLTLLWRAPCAQELARARPPTDRAEVEKTLANCGLSLSS